MIEKIHLSKTDEQLSNLIYRNEHTREHCLKHLNSIATNFTFTFVLQRLMKNAVI